MSISPAATLVALLLIESVRINRKDLEPGSEHEFTTADAERLVARGAAYPANEAGARARGGAVREVVKEVVKEVIKEVEVRSLSKDGARFISMKNEQNIAALIGETTDPATLAEFQALEYRREAGPRAAVLQALGAQFDAIAGAPDA